MPCPPPQICSLMKRLHIPRHTQVLSPPTFHSSSSLCLSLPPPENFYTSSFEGSENATSPGSLPHLFFQPVRTFIFKKKKKKRNFHLLPESHSTTHTIRALSLCPGIIVNPPIPRGYTSMAQPMYFRKKRKWQKVPKAKLEFATC